MVSYTEKMIFRFSIMSVLIFCLTVYAQGQKKRKHPEIAIAYTEEHLLKAEMAFIEAEKQLILENYTKAYELFVVARDLNPSNGTVYYKLAELLAQSNDYEKALDQINQAISLDGGNKYFFVYKAEIQKALKDYAKATETYEWLTGHFTGTEEYLFDLAVLYQYQNKFEKALEVYGKLEAHFGRSEGILLEKQKIYLRQNKMEELLADWDALIRENPEEEAYVLELCNILIANNEIEKARKYLKQFSEAFPDNANVNFLLSEIERKNGDFAKALELLKKPAAAAHIALDIKLQVFSSFIALLQTEKMRSDMEEIVSLLVDAHPDAYQARAFAGDVYLHFGQNEKALMYYRETITLNGSGFSIWKNITNLEAQSGQYDSLVRHAGQALDIFPNQAIFYYFHGFGNYMLKNHEKAIRSLEQGKKYTSEPSLLTIFYGQLGDVYHGLHDFEKSDAAYEKALQNQPDNDHVLNNYSYYLSLRGQQLEKARDMSAQLVKKFPDNPTYLDTHGWVLYVMGNYAEAVLFLQKAAAMEEDGTVIEHYGDVLFKLGRLEEAVQQWKRAKLAGGATEGIDKKIEEQKLYE